MITLNITDDQIERAKEHYDFDALNGSITKGRSNIYGALGEIVVYDYFKDLYDVKIENTYDYDLIIKDYKVDVKTKRTTVVPKPFYLCSISNHNIKQKCDYYYFVRIRENKKICFLLGYIKKSNFFKKGFYKNRGDKDINGFIFKDNCYNLKIENLNKFKVLKNS